MTSPLLPVVIVEKSGKFRPVIFSGSMLPRQPSVTNFKGRQRTKVTRYTGNLASEAQVLGPEWEPISFSGLLEDRRIGVRGAAVAMMYLIQQVAEAGRECLFNYGPVFRRVLWKSWDFRVLELARIAYKIELEVLDDGLGQRKRVRRGTRATPSTNNSLAASNAVISLLSALPKTVGEDALDGATDSMGNVVTHTVGAGSDLTFVGEPGQLAHSPSAQSALLHLEKARSEIKNTRGYARHFNWNAAPEVNDFRATMDTGRKVLRARSSISDAARELISLREKVAVLAGKAEAGQVYIAASGDTLQSISQRFYGTPTRWHEIFHANGLTSPTLAGGEQLLLKDVPTPDIQVFR